MKKDRDYKIPAHISIYPYQKEFLENKDNASKYIRELLDREIEKEEGS